MKLNTIVETPEGRVKVDMELKPEEANYILEAGFNYLVATGAIHLHSLATPKQTEGIIVPS